MRTTNKKPTQVPPEPTEADIQKTAYHLWIEGGCLEGVELDNWLAAKELVRHRHGAKTPARQLPPGYQDRRPLETLT